MFCPKCGTESQDDPQLCSKCGTRLSTPTDNPTTVTAIDILELVAQKAEQAQANPTAVPMPDHVGVDAKSTRRITKVWSWFLVLFVIALIGLVVFGSVSYNNALPRVRFGQADRE